MTDTEILQLVKEEKFHPAIKKLYTCYPMVKKHILQNSGSKMEAEDVFQDALVVFFNKVKAGNFELSASLNTYLFGIARLLWLEELRRKNKRMGFEKTAMAETQVSYLSEVELQEEDKIKRAQQAVEQLGEKCKQILELFYFKKVSMKEIAKHVGFSSEKGAKNQKYRCIEKAKAFLQTNLNILP